MPKVAILDTLLASSSLIAVPLYCLLRVSSPASIFVRLHSVSIKSTRCEPVKTFVFTGSFQYMTNPFLLIQISVGVSFTLQLSIVSGLFIL